MQRTTQTTREDGPAPNLVAVIELGSSAVRMVVAEVRPDGGIRTLESLSQPVALGKDVFVSRRIGRDAAAQAVKVLEGFREVMRQYHVSTCRAVGTSALREAQDRDTFLDRIYMRTGIDVEVIEPIEENRLGFAAVRRVLGDRLLKEDALLIEVGSGNTDLTVLRKGDVALSHTIRSGSLRLLRERGGRTADRAAFVQGVRQRVAGAAEMLLREFSLGRSPNFVALGSEVRLLARRAGKSEKDGCAALSPAEFRDFVRDISRLSEDDIVERYRVPYADAETLLPALLVYEKFLDIARPKRILVPMVSMRDGLLLELAQIEGRLDDDHFSRQIVASAEQLARKFRSDEAHAQCVAELSLQLFDHLQDEHGLGRRERLLLHVAAVLHDIGMFVGTSSHHKHGMYLTQNSEIFGLRQDDLAIVGCLVRYHRHALPEMRHPEYAALSREDRVRVSKLAAFLRLADVLDRSHRQQCRRLEFERDGDELALVMPGAADISLERAGLPEKANLFEQVFAMTVVLRSRMGETIHGA